MIVLIDYMVLDCETQEGAYKDTIFCYGSMPISAPAGVIKGSGTDDVWTTKKQMLSHFWLPNELVMFILDPPMEFLSGTPRPPRDRTE